jgi:signal transduction histidine kinase
MQHRQLDLSALLLNMFQQLRNWRTLLALLAIVIVSGTVWYSSYLARKTAHEERQKVEQWVEASTSLLNPTNTGDTRLHLKVIQDNDDIPIIETTEKDSINNYMNLDTTAIREDAGYLYEKLRQFKKQNDPIIWTDPLNPKRQVRYYYGNSRLLIETRYFPLVQLVIVALFITLTILALRTNYRSTQNQVWAGMAKETAHQLGTPVSSLEGWVEILKESHGQESFVTEIERDVSRLRLVTDRFGKIGSKPQLESMNIVTQVEQMVDYMRKRAGGRVVFQIAPSKQDITARISGPLFDWVIENLLKNALDAMEGKGTIKVDMEERGEEITIDVADSGKGISKQNMVNVFKPGFTTKKRGWGLGLSLSKRIVEQYHQGSLFIKQSEPGKGTTFRIVLKK